jgi:hypothetical protein
MSDGSMFNDRLLKVPKGSLSELDDPERTTSSRVIITRTESAIEVQLFMAMMVQDE